MRDNTIIYAEIEAIEICIKKEENYLANGQRLGTFHNPKQRLKKYHAAIFNLKRKLR